MNLQQPRVTWLMSVKNSMPHLPETLKSIANQTYANHKALVWDDCSTDGTLEELQRWIPSRIPGKIYQGRSMKLGPTLAFLVQEADTELCARIDGDDINLPHRLERQVEFMTAHPEVGVLGGQHFLIDDEGRDIPSWKFRCDDASIRWLARYFSQIAHTTVMFRKDRVLAAGNYRDTKVEDNDLWIRMCPSTPMAVLPYELIYYRRSTSSMTGTFEWNEWMGLFRSAARVNASILFPGTPDPEEAMELWEVSHPWQLQLPSKFKHIRQLKTAALKLAEMAGKPANYFADTELFQHQHYSLKTRWYKQSGLMPLVNVYHRMRQGGARAAVAS